LNGGGLGDGQKLIRGGAGGGGGGGQHRKIGRCTPRIGAGGGPSGESTKGGSGGGSRGTQKRKKPLNGKTNHFGERKK